MCFIEARWSALAFCSTYECVCTCMLDVLCRNFRVLTHDRCILSRVGGTFLKFHYMYLNTLMRINSTRTYNNTLRVVREHCEIVLWLIKCALAVYSEVYTVARSTTHIRTAAVLQWRQKFRRTRAGLVYESMRSAFSLISRFQISFLISEFQRWFLDFIGDFRFQMWLPTLCDFWFLRWFQRILYEISEVSDPRLLLSGIGERSKEEKHNDEHSCQELPWTSPTHERRR